MQAADIVVKEATRIMLASPLSDYIVHGLLKMTVGHPYLVVHVEQPI
jgi:hypothetical protein